MRAAVDVGGDRDQLGIEGPDLDVQLGDACLDVGYLDANLLEQRGDAVVLRGYCLELGAREVELAVEVDRPALELCELVSLSLEGSRQRLLRRLCVCELCAGFGQLGLGISGKGRAAGLSCDDAPSHRQQGDERDGETRPPPHRAVIRMCNLPLCPVAVRCGAMVPDA